jgi:hypothetical protein
VATGYAAALATALIVIGLAVSTAWQRNVNYVRADSAVQAARDDWNRDPATNIAYYEKAVRLAPDVHQYGLELGNFYGSLAENATTQPQQTALLRAGFEADLAAWKINRLERDANFHLAESAWALGMLGDAEMAELAIERYEFLTEIAPRFELVWTRLAQMNSIVNASSVPGTR